MIRSFRSRAVAVTTGVLLAAATLVSVAPVAQAETAAAQIPATITATPTTGLVSGSTVTVTAAANTNWNIYSLRARLCNATATIDNAGDFSPTLGGNCIDAPLAANTDSDVTVTTLPGQRSSASLDFVVGAGSTTFTTQYDGSMTIACGVTSTTGCKLVVEMSASNLSSRVTYKSFPLTYATPDAPTAVVAAHGVGKSLVSWTAPDTHGLPAITGYTVTSSPGSLTCTTATTSCTVNGLTNGTNYTFSVTATNVLGTSTASTASNSVKPTLNPWVVTATPTTALISGDTVAETVAIDAGYSIYSIRTRLCASTATISNAGDFSPTLGGNCINAPLAVATSSDVNVNTTVGNRGSASLDFIVGAGSTTFTTQYDGSVTIACGSATPTACKLVTEVSYTTPLNAAKVVYVDVPVTYAVAPSAPSAPSAVRGNAKATVSWTAPASDLPITGYRAEAVGTLKSCTTTGATTCEIAGLTNTSALNPTSYTFRVRAISAAGTGAYSSASDAISPTTGAASAPKAPAGLTLDSASDGVFTFHWTKPVDNGATLTGYTVTATPVLGGTALTCPATRTSTSCTISDATNGVKYVIAVSATNAVGNGLVAKLNNKMTTAAPTAPVAPTVSVRNGSAVVSWGSWNANGAKITLFTVKTYANGTLVANTCTTKAATSCTVLGLTNGTEYTFTVSAINAVGTTESAASIGATPAPQVPSTPANVKGTQLTNLKPVTVSWAAPANNGSAIIGYAVTVYKDNVLVIGKGCSNGGAVAKCDVSGLTANTTYTFKVIATNGIGASLAGTSAAFTTLP